MRHLRAQQLRAWHPARWGRVCSCGRCRPHVQQLRVAPCTLLPAVWVSVCLSAHPAEGAAPSVAGCVQGMRHFLEDLRAAFPDFWVRAGSGWGSLGGWVGGWGCGASRGLLGG